MCVGAHLSAGHANWVKPLGPSIVNGIGSGLHARGLDCDRFEGSLLYFPRQNQYAKSTPLAVIYVLA